MKKLLPFLFLFASVVLAQAPAPTPVSPLNKVGVATSCDNLSNPCTYVDSTVVTGQYFYFVVAETSGGYSKPSNKVDVTIPTGTGHKATLKWTPPAVTNGVTYFIYRGAPPSNLKVTGSK